MKIVMSVIKNVQKKNRIIIFAADDNDDYVISAVIK